MKHLISDPNFGRRLAAITIALALSCAIGAAQSIAPPNVPPALVPPAGNVPFLKAAAVGTQNYICLPSGWTFLGPQATLFVTTRFLNTDVRQQVATHFLSPNASEGGTARPTWQSSIDTSAIWAKAIANSTDPAFVASGAIPWLLLQIVGAQRGPAGGDFFSPATYIQRVNTNGGVIPTTACTVGAVEFVPYTADYVFYRPGR